MQYHGIHAHPAFATTDVVNFPDHTVFTTRLSTLDLPAHRSNFGLITVLYGSMKISLGGIVRSIDNSSFAIVNKNSTLSMSVSNEHSQPFILYFRNSSGWKGEDWNIAERIYGTTDALKERINTLASFGSSCSSFISMQADAIIRSTLAEIVSLNVHSINESMKLEVKKKLTRNENYKKLAIARDWIENNFTQSLSLSDLAQLTSMNEHFLRQFKRVFHKTPHQYLIDRRIEEARKLLRSSDHAIQGVCSAVGWESLATFTHLFKQRTGVTPGEFRAMSGSDNVL
jgi:AraC-like DNA-binding protein